MTEPSITQINVPENFIDLGMGNPDLDLLPVEMLGQSAESFFRKNDPRYLQYGLEQGDGYFRRALAEFLKGAYRRQVDPELLFVTAGASSALDLLCTLFTRPGDTIFVEEPSYFLALRIFEDHGLRAIPLPMDNDGLNIAALDEKLAETLPKFIYTIPAFQNPSGITLSPVRQGMLVERAQQHDFQILADEAYQFLPLAQTKPRSFAEFASEVEQVISINSFSKILAPGLRLGWIQAHKVVIQRLAGSGLLESGGGMNPYTSTLVRGLIESGSLEANIANLRKEYGLRLKAVDVALQTHLPTAEYKLPEGGFFFWARLPGVDASELRNQARDFKVDFRQGILFSSRSGLNEYLRLSFCFYKPDEIEEGILRLGKCMESYSPQ
jgi:DNA-binding transcriptional MocR family regulator